MFTDIADGNANYRFFFANVDTILFRLTLAHKCYVDILNVAKNEFGNTFCREKGLSRKKMWCHVIISSRARCSRRHNKHYGGLGSGFRGQMRRLVIFSI